MTCRSQVCIGGCGIFMKYKWLYSYLLTSYELHIITINDDRQLSHYPPKWRRNSFDLSFLIFIQTHNVHFLTLVLFAVTVRRVADASLDVLTSSSSSLCFRFFFWFLSAWRILRSCCLVLSFALVILLEVVEVSAFFMYHSLLSSWYATCKIVMYYQQDNIIQMWLCTFFIFSELASSSAFWKFFVFLHSSRSINCASIVKISPALILLDSIFICFQDIFLQTLKLWKKTIAEIADKKNCQMNGGMTHTKMITAYKSLGEIPARDGMIYKWYKRLQIQC
jgi:hypothetical protein